MIHNLNIKTTGSEPENIISFHPITHGTQNVPDSGPGINTLTKIIHIIHFRPFAWTVFATVSMTSCIALFDQERHNALQMFPLIRWT